MSHLLEIYQGFPVLPVVKKYGQIELFDLVGLPERKCLKEFVERAESSRKYHYGLGVIEKPEFSHEKIIELEIEFRGYMGIGVLFIGQFDVEADGFFTAPAGAAIGRLLDSRSAASAYVEFFPHLLLKGFAEFCQLVGELLGRNIIMVILFNPR